MKVRDLINELKRMPLEMNVAFRNDTDAAMTDVMLIGKVTIARKQVVDLVKPVQDVVLLDM